MYTIDAADWTRRDHRFTEDALEVFPNAADHIIQVAWQVYVNAVTRNGMLIAGRHSHQQFDWGATEATLKALAHRIGGPDIAAHPIPVGIVMKKPDGKPGEIVVEYHTIGALKDQRGAILDEPDWALLVNDAWVLGGINSAKHFTIVSPLSWVNLWSRIGKTWRQWFLSRSPGDAVTANGRMTVTAREMIGLKDMGGYAITRHGAHLIVAEPPKTRAGHRLTDYRAAVAPYKIRDGSPGPQSEQPDNAAALKRGLFRTLRRNTTFHASPHLIIDGTLKTVQQYLGENPDAANVHQDILRYDPQGPMLLQADPAQPYTMQDLNTGLAAVFARNPNAAYVLDLRGANLADVDPYGHADAPTATGDECYLILTLADLSGAKFRAGDSSRINILFAEGIYNGTDFSDAELGGVRGQIWRSNYDDTTTWPGGFKAADEDMTIGYDTGAPAFHIYED